MRRSFLPGWIGSVWFLAALSWPAAGGPPASRADVRALVEPLQARYEGVRTIRARFIEVYESRVLGKSFRESGKVFIRRPACMRWEYEEPEKKLFVTAGDVTYFYIEEDHQVIISRMGKEQAEKIPTLLLVGKGDLLKDYVVSLERRPGKNVKRLKLVPKEPVEDYRYFLLDVDARGLRIFRVTAVDASDNRTVITFLDIEENCELDNSLFVFSIPDGVEIIEE
jgi:outer membrane lipoprotein carrier protein